MKFSDEVIQQASPYWEQATQHEFINGMVDGTLDKEAFKCYLLQDYAFIGAFVDLLSYATAYAKTMSQKNRLSTFLSMVSSEENDYFIRSFEALGVDESEYLTANVTFSPAITGFRDAIKTAIDSGAETGYENCLVIIACAEAVYCEWGVNHRAKAPKEFYFNEWITLHNNDYFQSFVNWLKQELDALGGYPEKDRQQFSKLFSHISQLEAQFFDECYAKANMA